MKPAYEEMKKYNVYAFWTWTWRWKQRNCGACSGSGYYDNDGSPLCGGCDGTGKERFRSDEDTALAKLKLQELGL